MIPALWDDGCTTQVRVGPGHWLFCSDHRAVLGFGAGHATPLARPSSRCKNERSGVVLVCAAVSGFSPAVLSFDSQWAVPLTSANCSLELLRLSLRLRDLNSWTPDGVLLQPALLCWPGPLAELSSLLSRLRTAAAWGQRARAIGAWDQCLSFLPAQPS